MTERRVQELIGLMQKNLECSICLEMLTKPVSTKCGHQFCNFCLMEFLKRKQQVPCPLCKKPITKRSLTERPQLGEIVNGVRSLISAFQNDTGASYSPPRGPQLMNFFPCTPEAIQPNSSGKKTKPSSVGPVSSAPKRNVRHSKRRRVQEDEGLSAPEVDSSLQDQSSSSVHHPNGLERVNPSAEQSSNSVEDSPSVSRTRSKTRRSKNNGEVKSKRNQVKGHSEANSETELIRLIKTGSHEHKKKLTVQTANNKMKSSNNDLVKCIALGSHGRQPVHVSPGGGGSCLQDDVDHQQDCQDNSSTNKDKSVGGEVLLARTTLGANDLGTDLSEIQQSAESDTGSKQGEDHLLFQTPLPVSTRQEREKIKTQPIRTSSRSRSNSKRTEDNVSTALTPDSVPSDTVSFCRERENTEAIKGKPSKSYGKKLLRDKNSDTIQKVADWFKTFPGENDNCENQTIEPVNRENKGRRSRRNQSKNKKEEVLGQKMKNLAKGIENGQADDLFGFDNIDGTTSIPVGQQIILMSAESQEADTVEKQQENESQHEGVSEEHTEEGNRIHLNNQKCSDSNICVDNIEMSTNEIQVLDQKSEESSIEQVECDVVPDTEQAKVEPAKQTIVSPSLGGNTEHSVPKRRKIFKARSDNRSASITNVPKEGSEVTTGKLVKASSEEVTTEQPKFQKDSTVAEKLVQNFKQPKSLQERLAALEIDSPGSDPYEFKSSQNTPKGKPVGKVTKRHRKQTKKVKLKKNPIDLFIRGITEKAPKVETKTLNSAMVKISDKERLQETRNTTSVNPCSEMEDTHEYNDEGSSTVAKRSQEMNSSSSKGGKRRNSPKSENLANPEDLRKLADKISEAEDHDLLTCSQDAADSIEEEMQLRSCMRGTSQFDKDCETAGNSESQSQSSQRRVRFREPVITDFVSPGKIDILAYRKAKEEFAKLTAEDALAMKKIQRRKREKKSDDGERLQDSDGVIEILEDSKRTNSLRREIAFKEMAPETVDLTNTQLDSPQLQNKLKETDSNGKSPVKGPRGLKSEVAVAVSPRNPMTTPTTLKAQGYEVQDSEGQGASVSQDLPDGDSDMDSSATDDLDIEPDVDQYEPANLEIQPDEVKQQLSQDEFTEFAVPVVTALRQEKADVTSAREQTHTVTVVEETPVIFPMKTVVAETPAIIPFKTEIEETPAIFSSAPTASEESLDCLSPESPTVKANSVTVRDSSQESLVGDQCSLPTGNDRLGVNSVASCEPIADTSTQDSVSILVPHLEPSTTMVGDAYREPEQKPGSLAGSSEVNKMIEIKAVSSPPSLAAPVCSDKEVAFSGSTGSVIICSGSSDSTSGSVKGKRKKRKSFMLEDSPEKLKSPGRKTMDGAVIDLVQNENRDSDVSIVRESKRKKLNKLKRSPKTKSSQSKFGQDSSVKSCLGKSSSGQTFVAKTADVVSTFPESMVSDMSTLEPCMDTNNDVDTCTVEDDLERDGDISQSRPGTNNEARDIAMSSPGLQLSDGCLGSEKQEQSVATVVPESELVDSGTEPKQGMFVLVPETVDDCMAMTTDIPQEIVPETLDFDASSLATSQACTNGDYSKDIDTEQACKSDKTDFASTEAQDGVTNLQLQEKCLENNSEQTKVRHASGVLISPEEGTNKSGHDSPADIFQMQSELPMVSYSPDGDTLQPVYLSDEAEEQESTLKECSQEREATVVCKENARLNGPENDFRNTKPIKRACVNSPGQMRNVSSVVDKGDVDSKLDTDTDSSQENADKRRQSGIRTARGFSNKRNVNRAGNTGSSGSSCSERLRSPVAKFLSPVGQYLRKEVSDPKQSPKVQSQKRFASTTQGTADRRGNIATSATAESIDPSHNSNDCGIVDDSLIQCEDDVLVLKASTPNQKGQKSPRPANGPESENLLKSPSRGLEQPGLETVSRDGLPEDIVDREGHGDTVHEDLCTDGVDNETCKASSDSAGTVRTEERQSRQDNDNVTDKSEDNASKVTKYTCMSSTEQTDRNTMEPNSEPSERVVPDSLPICSVDQTQTPCTKSHSQMLVDSSVDLETENKSPIASEPVECNDTNNTSTSFELDPAEVIESASKKKPEFKSSKAFSDSAFNMTEMEFGGSYHNDMDISCHGSDAEIDALDENISHQGSARFETSSPIHSSKPDSIIAIQESDIEGDEDDLDEPVRHARRPRKAVIVDSSDDDDSSQESRQLNLTSSSAISSQSEPLPTQERAALQRDLLRMKQEMAEIEAQLKRGQGHTPTRQGSRNDSADSGHSGTKYVAPVESSDTDSDDEDMRIDSDHSGEESDDLFMSPPPPVLLGSQDDDDAMSSQDLPRFVMEVTSLAEKAKAQMCDVIAGTLSPVTHVEPAVNKPFKGREALKDIDPNVPQSRERTVSVRGFLSTGLTLLQIQEVKKLAALNDCKFYTKFNSSVSHVIVKTVPEDENRCDRTLKFFQGIANKCWVVSYDWVSDSRQAGHLLPETPYEIKGDTITEEHHFGPRRARQSKSDLFEDFRFACIGNSASLTSYDLTELLEACGGLVLPVSRLKAEEGTALVISCTDFEEEEEDGSQAFAEEHRQLKQFYREYGLVSVSREWVLDSITTYKRRPLDDYILTKVKNIKFPSVS